MNRPKIPELLAPAGNLDTALAAFESGADAVYAGFKRFNARERTENFTFTEFSQLTRYARRNDKKVYLVFNTLIKENELGEAYELLREAADLAPDAVIVQDLGMLKLIKTRFPALAVHASTQMGIHNSAGVGLLKTLGVTRVILERQITFDEIRAIGEQSTLELEVFIHGALCCSLSGVCLFSSWMGGWSGNRGKCKQPCRRRYYTQDGNGFFFSTNDLSSLEAIPALKRLGVASLKIEGRLKKADYVAPVVQAYRMMLDTEEGGEGGVLKEARGLLSKSPGRYWFHGFQKNSDFSDVINHTSLGVAGSPCGEVLAVKENGFTIKATEPLRIGDKIRVQPRSGDEGPSLTITKLKTEQRLVTRLHKNSTGFIFCDKQVAAGGLVFKIGYSVKDFTGRIKEYPPYKKCFPLFIRIGPGGFHIELPNFTGALSWTHDQQLPRGQSLTLKPQMVISEFKKIAVSDLLISTVTVEIEGDLYLQQRDIRKIRQSFSQWLSTQKELWLVPGPPMDWDGILGTEEPADPGDPGTEDAGLEFSLTVATDRGGKLPQAGAIRAESVYTASPAAAEAILPVFCSQGDLSGLKQAVRRCYNQGIRRFRVTSLYALPLVRALKGVTIIAGFPLAVTNSLALRQLKDLGAAKATLWPELEEAVLEQLLKRWPQSAELYIHGRLPILQTRMKLPVQGRLTDKRGAVFYLKEEGGLASLYPEKLFSIPGEGAQSRFMDIRHSSAGEELSTFNYYRELL